MNPNIDEIGRGISRSVARCRSAGRGLTGEIGWDAPKVAGDQRGLREVFFGARIAGRRFGIGKRGERDESSASSRTLRVD